MPLAILAAVAIASLATPTGAMAQVPGGDQAHGVGTIENWPHCPPGSTTFDFSATSGPSGENPSGMFSFVCTSSSHAFSGTVSCLAVTGNQATLGGTITASTHPSPTLGVGAQLSFTVIDGGPAGMNDLISQGRQGAQCDVGAPGRQPISSGDIVVVDGTGTPPLPCPDDDADDDGLGDEDETLLGSLVNDPDADDDDEDDDDDDEDECPDDDDSDGAEGGDD